jgi:hypothetical protein
MMMDRSLHIDIGSPIRHRTTEPFSNFNLDTLPQSSICSTTSPTTQTTCLKMPSIAHTPIVQGHRSHPYASKRIPHQLSSPMGPAASTCEADPKRYHRSWYAARHDEDAVTLIS